MLLVVCEVIAGHYRCGGLEVMMSCSLGSGALQPGSLEIEDLPRHFGHLIPGRRRGRVDAFTAKSSSRLAPRVRFALESWKLVPGDVTLVRKMLVARLCIAIV